MSKFNKIYEYEYNLFGQVSEHTLIIDYPHVDLSVGSFVFFLFLILLLLFCLLLQNVSVSMTSVSGHLLGLEFKAPFQKW